MGLNSFMLTTSEPGYCNISSFMWLKMSEIHEIEVTMMYKAFISYKFIFQSICFDNLFPPNLLRMTQYDQFCLICNFSNLFPPKLLRIIWNSQFHLIHNFSCQSSSEWLRTANFTWFTIFLIFFHQSGSLLAKSQILHFFWGGGGYISQIFPDLQLFESFSTAKWPTMANFATKVAQIGSKWPIWVIFQLPRFYPKKQLRLTQNDQFHLICNFSKNL